MSFPDQVVLKSIANMAIEPIDIVRGYYAKIKKAREELNNA